MIVSYEHHRPRVHRSAFVASSAQVIGRVRIGREASIWFGAVLRGDLNRIVIGDGTNIQDHTVVHVERNLPCIIRNHVTVGHQAAIHACTIEEGALIGIGARILNGSHVGRYAIVGAGSVVLEGTKIPAYSLTVGIPARVVRTLSRHEIQRNKASALRYMQLARRYKKEFESAFSSKRSWIPVKVPEFF